MRLPAAIAATAVFTLLAPAVAAKPGGADKKTAKHQQAAPAETRKARAEVFFKQGIKAYRHHRYKDAIDAFLQAHHIYPSPTLSYNTARAYQKLHDDSGALKFYRAYLRQAPHASDRKRVEKRVEKLEARLHKKGVQQVTVLSKPVGATVIIDGRPVGVTPWTGEIFPGQHHLLLQRDGYKSTEQDFQLPDLTAIDLNATLAVAPPPPPVPPPAVIAKQQQKQQLQLQQLQSWHDSVSHHGVRLPTWIAFGVGAAALGGAAVFEGLRSSSEHSVKTEPTQLGRAAAYDQMKSRQTTARVLAAVGGGAVVIGGVLLYVDLSSSRSEKSARLDLSCTPGGCSADLGGRW